MLYYNSTESNDALERLVRAAVPKRFFVDGFLLQEEEYQSALPVNQEGHPLVEGWVPFDIRVYERQDVLFFSFFFETGRGSGRPVLLLRAKNRRTRWSGDLPFYQESFRSFSLIQPFLRSTSQNSVLSTAGSTKQISTRPAQSKAVMVLPICTQPV